MKNINPNNKSRIKPLFREFIKQNLPALLVIVITLLLGGFLEVFPVRFMQQIVNELITEVSFTKILRLVGLWYGCRVLGSLANFISGYFTG
jgi:ABC-type multidrug transport system fused ATPase/permease subunit